MKQGNLSKDEYKRREALEKKYKGERAISIEPPDTLTEEGKKIYLIILDNLPADVLNEADEYTVEVAADAIAIMRECRRDIAKNGLFTTYTNSAGMENRDQNKAVLVYQKYAEIFKKYIAELGLSPSARSKIANLASVDNPQEKKKTLMDILNEEDEDE